MEFSGEIRRADFNLRAKYPDLLTEIFQCAADKFVIYCPCDKSRLMAITQDFERNICPVGILGVVSLTTEKPASYQVVLPGLADEDIARNFAGISHTAITLLNLLLAKFPSVPFYEVKREDDIIQVITTTYPERLGDTVYHRYLNEKDKARVVEFLNGLELRMPCTVIEIPNLGPKPKLGVADPNPVRYIYAAKATPGLVLPYELRDEALWYDQIDHIFTGGFQKEDLYFFDSSICSCYVDYTYGNIDLRNHLLLFQRVYLTPPFGDYGKCDLTQWLRHLRITKNEFLELVARERVKLVLYQPSYRYDQPFILEVYEACPTGVITRRALAALVQIDLVEMADNYLLNQPQLLPELRTFCTLLSEHLPLEASYLYEVLSWPLQARRRSFLALQDNGIYSTSSFGVNNLLAAAQRNKGRDLDLEFTVTAANTHLASALNAIYFPYTMPDGGFSDQPFAAEMGSLLNFYKSATPSRFGTMVEGQQSAESGVALINPIELFDIDTFISIKDLERVIHQPDPTHAGSRQLMATLAALPPEQRQRRIDFYNHQLQQLDKRWLRPELLDLGLNATLDAISYGTSWSFLGVAWWVLSRGTKLAKKLSLVKHTLGTLEEAMSSSNPDRQNINYLSRINRVARLCRFPE